MSGSNRKPPRGTENTETPPARLPPATRSLVWLGSARSDISALPVPVRTSFGFRLREVQQGRKPLDAKPLPQFGVGVLELRERFDSNAYRLVHVVSLEKAVYVLHVFMKKSKSGIGLPKQDVELIEARLKRAQRMDEEAES